MIQVHDKETGAHLGEITEQQLKFLIDQLEEEYEEDQDYYINRPTLDMFADRGADPELIAFLKQAMGEREEMEIVWSRG
jgi:hypothetical protein